MTNLPPLPSLPPRRNPTGTPSQDFVNPDQSVAGQNNPAPFNLRKNIEQPAVIPPGQFEKPQTMYPTQVPVELSKAPQNASQGFSEVEEAPLSNEFTINGNILSRWMKSSLVLTIVLVVLFSLRNAFSNGFNERTISAALIIAVFVFGAFVAVGLPIIKATLKPIVFNLREGWVTIGKSPRQSISNIRYAKISGAGTGGNTKLILGFDEKNKTGVFINHILLSIKEQDKQNILQLVPYTSIKEQSDAPSAGRKNTIYPSKAEIVNRLS